MFAFVLILQVSPGVFIIVVFSFYCRCCAGGLLFLCWWDYIVLGSRRLKNSINLDYVRPNNVSPC